MKTKFYSHTLAFNLLALILFALPLFAELKYFPQDKEGLISLIANENIKLDEIDVSKITDMSFLFCEARDETRARNYLPECGLGVRGDYSGIEKWDVSNVETMEKMFWFNERFNEPIGDWNVSKVKNMGRIFAGATSFNQPLDKWDVRNVEDMGGMFVDTPFNQPLDKWDVSNVKDMQWMFGSNLYFNHPLNSWDVRNVKDMTGMFYEAKAFNQPLDKWNVSNVKDMSWMFKNATSFNQDLSSWDVRNVKDMSEMFNGASAFSYDFDWDLNGKRINGGLIGGTALYKRLYGEE